MKKMKKTPDWIKTLPVDINQLTFEELRNFKEFNRYLKSPIKGHAGWVYFMKCFRVLNVFSLFCIYDNRFPPLTKCWNELEKNFINDERFDDGVFVQSWIFCNFPCDNNHLTVLDHFEEFMNGNAYFSVFIKEMRKSRLGVYQEIFSSRKKTKFRELITGDTIEVFRSIAEYEKNEVFLTRLVKYEGIVYHLVDPKCWPGEYKSAVEGFINDKMNFFAGKTQIEKYEQLMRLGGPYWMSCVSTDQSSPIFPPDHYETFHQS